MSSLRKKIEEMESDSDKCQHIFKNIKSFCGNLEFKICLECLLFGCMKECCSKENIRLQNIFGDNDNHDPPKVLKNETDQMSEDKSEEVEEESVSRKASKVLNLNLQEEISSEEFTKSSSRDYAGDAEDNVSISIKSITLDLEDPFGALIKGRIGWAESPNEIFIIPQGLFKKLKYLDDNLKSYKKYEFMKDPKVGDYCLAIYKEEPGTWNRAKILDATKYESIKIQYLDYGNIESLELKDLRILPKESINFVPFLASLCIKLENVLPVNNEWSENSIKFLRRVAYSLNICKIKLIHYCNFEKKYFGRVYVQVKGMPKLIDLGTLLVKENFAIKCNNVPKLLRREQENVSPNDISQSPTIQETRKLSIESTAAQASFQQLNVFPESRNKCSPSTSTSTTVENLKTPEKSGGEFAMLNELLKKRRAARRMTMNN